MGTASCEVNAVYESIKKSHFHEILPDGRFKFRLDHHIINTFNQCERMFELRHIMTQRPKGTGAALSLGSWWSRVMELFYTEMAKGRLPEVTFLIKCVTDAWVEQGLHLPEALKSPGIIKFGGLEGGYIMAAQYYDIFAEADFKNWKIIAAEAGFGLKDEVKIGEDDNIIVYYVGKPDLFIYDIASKKVVILDHKTVAYIKNNIHIQYKPHPQMTGYIYAANILAKALGYKDVNTDRCIMNVCGRLPPSEKPRDGIKKPRFVRVYPSYSAAEIAEWQQSIMEKCSRLRHALITNTWPMTGAPFTCHIYGGCAYRRVCSVAPGSRNIVLAADFNKVDPWRAYEVEADEEED